WDSAWFAIPVLIFFATGLFVSLWLPYGAEITGLNALRFEPWNTSFAWITRLGEAPAFVLAGIFALFFRYRLTLLVALVGFLSIPVSYYLKDAFGVDRPVTYFEKKGLRDEIVLVPGVRINGGQTSFPSGHTIAAFALNAVLAAAASRRRPYLGLILASVPILVGFSRIFLAQHFISDVVAGAVIGLGLAVLVLSINSRLLPPDGSKLDQGILFRS
ncbi:MAG: phosphatase PAP2 family protein, partial [Saprospiraceae bacterium]